MSIRCILSYVCIIASVSFVTFAHADQHSCPSIAAIKQHLTDKNLGQIKYTNHDGFGWSNGTSARGYIEFTDHFDTNETWSFQFEVTNVWDQNRLWDFFQNYINNQPELNREASDKYPGYYGQWTCYYTVRVANFGMGLENYTVFAHLVGP